MMTIRRAAERGHGEHGWLDTWHTFSFGEYHDPEQMGFGALRVINEDRVAPTRGFGTHPHRDMEIVTYVLEGALEHKDSLGHGAVLRPGEVQRITAGTGIEHSEFNPSATEAAHFYQIWLLPDRRGHKPEYAQKAFAAEGRDGRWQTIASPAPAPGGRDGALSIHQDASILLADVRGGQSLSYEFGQQRYGWLQVLGGEVNVGANHLAAGDGLAISDEPALRLSSATTAKVMLFDLP